MLTDIRWSDNEQHSGTNDTTGNRVCKRVDLGFLSRSADNNDGVRHCRNACILEENIPSLDMHTSVTPLSSFIGIVLFLPSFP